MCILHKKALKMVKNVYYMFGCTRIIHFLSTREEACFTLISSYTPSYPHYPHFLSTMLGGHGRCQYRTYVLLFMIIRMEKPEKWTRPIDNDIVVEIRRFFAESSVNYTLSTLIVNNV